jgi:nucleolar MIF4G domain-containing protein 1
MPRQAGPTLPARLLKQLDVQEAGVRGRNHKGHNSRKFSRKEERAEKRAKKRHTARGRGRPEQESEPESDDGSETHHDQAYQMNFPAKQNMIQLDTSRSESRPAKAHDSQLPSARTKKATNKLAEDDAEIAALERKLGLRKRKELPQSFHDEGLAGLMGGLDSSDNDEKTIRAKRKVEADQWLSAKRRKMLEGDSESEKSDELVLDSGSGTEFLEIRDGEVFGDVDKFGNSDDASVFGGSGMDESDGMGGGGVPVAPSHRENEDERKSPPRSRENPYVAPIVGSVTKYVPPARRQIDGDGNSELFAQLRKRIRGLVNRVGEANLLTVLADIEQIYRDYPRHHVTDVLASVLLDDIGISDALPEGLSAPKAAFATAVYRVVGIDFGAHLVQGIVSRLKETCEAAERQDVRSDAATKQSVNLISFIAELYSFQMIGCNLVFDYVRRLLENLSEFNAAMLLRIVRMSGTQLRKDDPLALRDISGLTRPALTRTGSEQVSARTKVMIDTITDLKNNKLKEVAKSAAGREKNIRLKKALGSLNSKNLKATEPLRVGLQDLEQSETRGKWWLVGASWAGRDVNDMAGSAFTRPNLEPGVTEDVDLGAWGNAIPDIGELEALANDQGMNTPTRRAIFISLLQAADISDAYRRIANLKLKRHERLEVANIIVQCVGSEETYNNYYAYVAEKVCQDRRMSFTFQSSLWKIFQRLGEPLFGENGDDEVDETLDARRLQNIARFYAYLVAKGELDIKILRCLELASLGEITRGFVDDLLLEIFRRLTRRDGCDMDSVRDIFAAAKEDHNLIVGLRIALKRLRKSRALQVEDKKRAKGVKETLKVAIVTLEKISQGD